MKMLRHFWRNWLIEAFERAKEEARKKAEEGWERREREARISQEEVNVDESLAVKRWKKMESPLEINKDTVMTEVNEFLCALHYVH